MSVEKLNSWIGVVANIGVLVGLVFLALEVRQASDIGQAQMADAAVAGEAAPSEAPTSAEAEEEQARPERGTAAPPSA